MNIIKDGDIIIAIIISHNYKKNGIEFVTPNNYPLQLAYMNHKSNHKILPHIHKKSKRIIEDTMEVLFIKSGKIKIDLYGKDKKFIKSEVLYQNDTILLASGGHAFHMLEDSEIIEVKQGPYTSVNEDKEMFDG